MLQKTSIFHNTAARNGFNQANPIDFSLFDDEGLQAIYILNDQAPGRTQHLAIVNNGPGSLSFVRSTANSRPGPANKHFELRFRPGTLDPDFIAWLAVGTNGWRLRADTLPDGTVSVYLLYVGDEDLTLPAGQIQVLILQHVKAGASGGSRGSRMELRYHSDGSQLFPTPTGPQHYRQERLQIISNRGKKELPMLAAFDGSSTVLNDGTIANSLTLQISNFLQNDTIRLSARDSERPTKFILSFDTSETPAAWALTDADNAAAIDVELHFDGPGGLQWYIRPELQGANPQWVITLLDDIDVEVGAFFHLHLRGLKTSMPSGFTKLYLLYENIPGFWDGRFEVPIEKSPLKFDDQKTSKNAVGDGAFIQRTQVGIGNTEPTDTLDVNGGVRSETLILRNGARDFPPARTEQFPLDVNGKIKAKGLELEGDLSGDVNLNSKSLELSDSLSIGKGTSKIKATTETKAGVTALKIEGRLKDSTGFVIPPGGIIMWSGETVPEGWKLCDGTQGTPDLRGRFVVGYNSGEIRPNDTSDDNTQIRDDLYKNPGNLSENGTRTGEKGGKKMVTLEIEQLPRHSHDIEDPGHAHSYADSVHQTSSDSGGGVSNKALADRTTLGKTTGSSTSNITLSNTGGDQPHENRPPFYVLAFIMKT